MMGYDRVACLGNKFGDRQPEGDVDGNGNRILDDQRLENAITIPVNIPLGLAIAFSMISASSRNC